MTAKFIAPLHRPVGSEDENWGFVILPKNISHQLPRRGRTTVSGEINGNEFMQTLEPDGKKSHWMRISQALQEASGVTYGDELSISIKPLDKEPDPEVPDDFQGALVNNSDAQKTWYATTPLARVDWIHWITSAKQPNTRKKRINDACGMLASGKKRVCCFDPSGFYSKALRAPEIAD